MVDEGILVNVNFYIVDFGLAADRDRELSSDYWRWHRVTCLA